MARWCTLTGTSRYGSQHSWWFMEVVFKAGSQIQLQIFKENLNNDKLSASHLPRWGRLHHCPALRPLYYYSYQAPHTFRLLLLPRQHCHQLSNLLWVCEAFLFPLPLEKTCTNEKLEETWTISPQASVSTEQWLLFHKTKNISKISTKYNGQLQVFPSNGMKCISRDCHQISSSETLRRMEDADTKYLHFGASISVVTTTTTLRLLLLPLLSSRDQDNRW